ncbi:MAG: hypothetical protein ACRYFU_13100 [Janthinobacterium lividum]
MPPRSKLLAPLLLVALTSLRGNAQCVRRTAAVPLQSAPPSTSRITAGFHSAVPVDAGGTAVQIVFNDLSAGDQSRLSNAFNSLSSWAILVDGRLSTVHVTSSLLSAEDGFVTLQLSAPLGRETLASHTVTLLFAGDPSSGVTPETVKLNVQKPASSGWQLPSFRFTEDKRNPNLDVTGSLQTAVGATPLYSWTVLARYPIEHNGRVSIFRFGPQFTGIASQQTNGDPDSLNASAAGELDFPLVCLAGRFVPINLLFNPINYEFERKAKQEAILSSGLPTLHAYQRKNTNLIASGQVQIVEAFLPVNVNLNLGTEIGTAISRSAVNLTSQTGYSDSPLRAVAAADVYFNLPTVARYPLLAVDGHYTVRALFHPEPFQQDGVNDGNQFYSTKARHFIAVNMARTLVPGASLTVQYRFGSLPPTFSFVDHQVTLGIEIVLGK